MKWTKKRSALAHAAKARKRMDSPPEPEMARVPAGEYLGTLSWHAADGTLRRWVVRQGLRANAITVIALTPDSDLKRRTTTFTALLSRLRACLSLPRRLFDI